MRGLSAWVWPLWQRLRAAVARVLAQNVSPRQIALGAAVGVFAASLPLPFFQVILAALLATLLRANQLAALTTVWLANPAFFYVEYVIGLRLLERLHPTLIEDSALSWNGFRERLGESIFPLVRNVMLPTTVGAVVFGLGCAAAAYAATLWLVSWKDRLIPRAPAELHGDGSRETT